MTTIEAPKRTRRPLITYIIGTRIVRDVNSKGKRLPKGKSVVGRFRYWDRRFKPVTTVKYKEVMIKGKVAIKARSTTKYESDNVGNVRDALNYVLSNLRRYHIGGFIYATLVVDGIRQTGTFSRIYVAKWGHDNKPFKKWYGVAGEYWRRKVLNI